MARRSNPRPAPIATVVVHPPFGRGEVVAVCAQAGAALAANGADLVECDVAALLDPDIGAIDGLARLALTARRHDGSIRLLGAGMRLRSLLALAGLADVMPCVSAGSDVEPRR